MSDEVHPKNRLNDLSNREWIRETKSFWMSAAAGVGVPATAAREFTRWLRETRDAEEVEELLGQLDESFVFSETPPRSKLKSRHPATFSEADVERLIRLFTKAGERVLDPFVGSGSTLIACLEAGRGGVGVELSEEWAGIAKERIREETASPRLELEGEEGVCETEVLVGDARQVLGEMDEASFDFIVTSPPYWSILTKKAGLKAQAERESRGLATQYSESDADLGNIESYEGFLDELGAVFGECHRVLRPKRYMAVIVSDFRHGPKFHLFHADVAGRIEAQGIDLKGVTILAQDNKNLYPFGIPYTFVSNVHHQYILIFQKPAE